MAGHDLWYTPPELFGVLDAEFRFDLDAAAEAHSRKCERFISPEQDGLTTSWAGRAVWCNPPYTMISEFVYRAWAECQTQRNTVVLLIPAYTDPGYWWECIVPFADEIRFLKGRVSFLERGEGRTSARFPSVIIVFRWRRGIAKGFPRVWWWDWKTETRPEMIAPLLMTGAI